MAVLVGRSRSAATSCADPLAYFYNPAPPVEFFARGVDVEVAWAGGGTLRSTGNSFATPHISGHLRARARASTRS